VGLTGGYMGMFDYIRVELPLPDFLGNPADVEFQTKSFENLMDYYVITFKGELYREKYDYKWNDNPDSFLGGHMQQIKDSYRREYLTDFHGDVIFYSGLDNNKVFKNYHARFTDGKLTRIWYTETQY
jgi:hypothetical protein